MSPDPPPPAAVAPHDVAWTRAKVERFWSWWTDWSIGQPFFSEQYAAAILDFARSVTALDGLRVLDVGAGPGYLVEALLADGALAGGMELSAKAVDAANRRLAGRPGFLGFTQGSLEDLNVDDVSHDAVFAVEVVEHLLDDMIDPFFREAVRVLRPGGLLFLSTPNDEDIEAHRSLCPECGAAFHPMQHVQRWSSTSLPARASRAGFEAIAVRETSLYLGSAPSRTVLRLKRLLRFGPPHHPANLLYAGKIA